MTLERFITVSFFVVSLVGLVVQAWALGRLWRADSRSGLWRTSACRVGCAVLYVLVGINAWALRWAVLQVTFVAFCLTQGTWQINAWLDVRLGAARASRPRPLPAAPLTRKGNP
jgi:hypothetical protein